MAEPLCPYFNNCGGCSSQHVDYSTQVDQKKKALASAIEVDENQIKVFTGKEYHYRNRMDMIFHQKGIGFRKKREWKHIIDIEQCVISNERLNQLIKEVRSFFRDVDYFDIMKNKGTFRYAVIRTPSNDSSISFVLNPKSTRLSDAIEKIKLFAEKSTADNIVVAYVDQQKDASISDDYFVVKGSDMLKEKFMGKEFMYSTQGFFQNNSEMAEKMQEYCHKIFSSYNAETGTGTSTETKKTNLLDLYGGVGTFGIINAELFKSVLVVENSKQSIDAANLNIKNNNITNAKAIVLDATNLKKLNLETPLFVITDPPRTGMDNRTILELNTLKPKVIVYISCNVQQLGKDINKFPHYEIKSAALFDLFPQTFHSEAIIELVLKNKNF